MRKRSRTATIFASASVVVFAASSCPSPRPVHVAGGPVPQHVAPAASAPSAAAAVPIDDNWCGETLERDALHALVEARIAEHSAAFAACAPTRGQPVVIHAHIVLDVCGRGSRGTTTPSAPFSPTEECIDRVLRTLPFASVGDMKLWHEHDFVFP